MIVLFGPAGSGKGTQGKILSEVFGWKWLSVGEVIRQTGKYAEVINSGHLIPDNDVINLMNKQIEKCEEDGFDVILDGYPRDEAQAKYIVETMSGKIDGAIVLEVPKEELLKRLALRGRDDDKEGSSIEQRFEIFENNIKSILPLFENKNIPVEHIDGTGTIEEIADRLASVVEKMNPSAIRQKDDVNGREIGYSYDK